MSMQFLGRHTKTTNGLALLMLVCTVALARISSAQNATLQNPTLKTTLSQSQVRVAEPFDLQLSVRVPEGCQVTFPVVNDQLGDFEVIGHREVSDLPDTDSIRGRTWHQFVTLESTRAGDLTVPQLEVQLSGSAGQQVLRSEPLGIRVQSSFEEQADPTQFRDIQSVVDAAESNSSSQSWIWLVLAFVGIFGVASVGFFIARRPRWISPRHWALAELTKLEQVPFTAEDSNSFVARLTNIITKFMELELGLPASAWTAEELLHELKACKSISSEEIYRLQSLLTLVDQAKFAGLRLTEAERRNSITQARELLERITRVSK